MFLAAGGTRALVVKGSEYHIIHYISLEDSVLLYEGLAVSF